MTRRLDLGVSSPCDHHDALLTNLSISQNSRRLKQETGLLSSQRRIHPPSLRPQGLPCDDSPDACTNFADVFSAYSPQFSMVSIVISNLSFPPLPSPSGQAAVLGSGGGLCVSVCDHLPASQASCLLLSGLSPLMCCGFVGEGQWVTAARDHPSHLLFQLHKD